MSQQSGTDGALCAAKAEQKKRATMAETQRHPPLVQTVSRDMTTFDYQKQTFLANVRPRSWENGIPAPILPLGRRLCFSGPRLLHL